MMRRSIVLLSMLAMACTALAQAPAPPQTQGQGGHSWSGAAAWRQKMEQRRMERLTVLLDLTPAQRRQVQAILSDEHARMKARMQQVEEAVRQARIAHEAVRKDAEQRLAAVLNPTQMKKLRVLMPEHPGRALMMRHGCMGPMPPPGSAPGPASP